MPAVDVDDKLQLPRLSVPETPRPVMRPVRTVTTAISGFEGEGFPVRRSFAGISMADLDPFVHMDQMGAINYAPGEPKGTPWHPHRGFETVTYMIDGTFQHQDSIGGGGIISNGATQWMTAGSGILHIERPPEDLIATGGLFHGIQLWVNLPAAKKWINPRYQDIGATQVKLLTSQDGGALIRLIAGSIAEFQGPGETNTEILMMHITLQPGARFVIPWPADFNALACVLQGDGTAGSERAPVSMGKTVLYGPGDALEMSANASQSGDNPSLEVLMLGGIPIREPVAAYGPFVMNTRAEIAQAFEDYQSGKLGTVPAIHIGS